MTVTVHHGDCLNVLAEMPDASVDAIVTDPPYGLEFMGKDWDAPWKPENWTDTHRTFHVDHGMPLRPYGACGTCDRLSGERGTAQDVRQPGDATFTATNNPYGRSKVRHGAASSYGKDGAAAMRGFQAWCEEWMTECLRVLKPGGHMLAFGGSRTWHRLAAAAEDAGFEMRDSIAWLYGSGFPKSLDVSKAIDKLGQGEMRRAKLIHFATERGIDGRWLQAQGVADSRSFADWTTEGHSPSERNWALIRDALGVAPEEEAAFEREVIGAGKSGAASVAFVRDSAGTYNITAPATPAAQQWSGWGTALKPAFEPIVVARKPLVGTVAANVLAHGAGAINVEATKTPEGRWPTNVVLDGDAADALDAETGILKSGSRAAGIYRGLGYMGSDATDYPEVVGDSGGASRFFPTFRYQAKAPTSERPSYVKDDGTKVAHSTVKPLALMRWLIRLVTPPGGTVLDPFAGSGATAEAALFEGAHCIAIERDVDYLPLIQQRITRSTTAQAAADALALFDTEELA